MQKAWRASADDGFGGVTLGSIQTGSVVMTARYDGLGRRIVKAVKNSADLNATYHYHYHHQQLIETRNGSDLVLKQHVWAPGSLNYIDELVQIALNDDPVAGDECESVYFALHNANYNVMALVDAAGAMVERYEYSPYGQRQVYFSPGANDPGAHAPIAMSRRWSLAGGGTAAPADGHPYGLNTLGHQGLMHDEHTGLVHNRARTLHPQLGRFMQRDPLNQNQPGGGYQDGMNLYQYLRSNASIYVDPSGNAAWAVLAPCIFGAIVSASTDIAVQACVCCWREFGWRMHRCATNPGVLIDCVKETNLCYVGVSAVVGCLTAYLPGPKIPTTITGLRLLAEKLGIQQLSKFLGKLEC